MNKNYIPRNKYHYVRKDDPKFISLESECLFSESQWRDSKVKKLKMYRDEHASVVTFIMTNEIRYRSNISYQPKLQIKNPDEFHIREKGYHKFVDITMQANPTNDGKITIQTLDEEIIAIRRSNEAFQYVQNLEQISTKLKCEEIVANTTFDISETFEVEPFKLTIHKLICHPIDTKPIHIYETVINIFSNILGIDSSQIKNKIEEKLKSYEFLYSEMNPGKLEFVRSDGTQDYDGMRLVWYNSEINPNSIVVKTVDAGSPTGIELKKLLTDTKEFNIATPCIPIYRNAIVYRDSENRIIGHFNICLECSKIESHNLDQMPVTIELMTKLNEIINSVHNNVPDGHVG